MKRLRLVALIAVLAVSSVACARTSSTPPAGGQTAGEQQLQNVQNRDELQCEPGKEAWRSKDAPKRGGIIRAAEQSPHLDHTAPGGRAFFHNNVYQYLIKPRACFFEDSVMQAQLAKSWQVSADGTTWTFVLRDDIKWQNKPPVNARAFTAADVAFTIDHQKGGGILKSFWGEVSYQVTNPTTVVLKTKEPQADFLLYMSDERNVMVPKEVKDQFGDFKKVAIGTGAFMIKDFKPEQLSVAERNPDYAEKGADGKALPYVDEVHYLAFGDFTAEIAAFRSGQLDFSLGSRINKLDSESLKAQKPNLRSFPNVAATIFAFWFDTTRAPWNDARVRQAVSYAIDRADLIEGSKRGGAVYSGFLPSSVKEYAWTQAKMAEKFKPDREKAKKLLADANFVQPDKLFVLKTVQSYAPEAEVIQKQLEAIGIKYELAVQPGTAVGPVIAKGDWDVAYGPPGGGRFADYWGGDLVRTGASRNVTRYSSAKIDALAVAQAKELDQTKRKQMLDQLQDILFEEMPYAPLISGMYFGFQSCELRNMHPFHQTTRTDGYAYAWSDKTGC
ncbi:MAG: ABC transporter substrate-binding protein [Chloroflexota bacterium]